jgi:ATP-dependent protease ClpP protease subunit
MPNWQEVLNEIQQETSKGQLAVDNVRRRYMAELAKETGRNLIAYYSGWLQKSHPSIWDALSINDDDKNGFMSTVHRLDRSKGVDLILHTPGGGIAATESIVSYLKKMFGINLRVIVPQIAMSAGTMIACAAEEILMGEHSNLGPIDPQYSGISCEGVLEEFRKALEAVKKDPDSLALWKIIIEKYHPTFLGDCEKTIKWSKEITREWLKQGMFKNDTRAKYKITKILSVLSSHRKTFSHGRHIPIETCENIGLKIVRIEKLGDKLQDLILTVHHAFMHTFANTGAIKIIENQNGIAKVDIRNIGR